MADLRPLTFAELLDRAFSLYRRNFLLFLGIAALPQIVVLAVRLVEIWFLRLEAPFSFNYLLYQFIAIVVQFFAYLAAQGATIFAVSDTYLGRPASIDRSFDRARDNFGTLLAVIVLFSLAVLGGSIFLVIPGIFLLCRLMVSVPAALIEQRSASDALGRSYRLTSGFGWRALGILAVGVALGLIAGLVVGLPIVIITATSRTLLGNPVLASVLQVLASIANIIVQPFSLIASAVFYFDLRVRKEAFDLQFMLDPGSESRSGDTGLSSITR